MNRTKKKINVRFFTVDAGVSYFEDLVAIRNSSLADEKGSRIVNFREKKHLIKVYENHQHSNDEFFFMSVVRERNTWQARALSNGLISEISTNQGIIGDPYYFLVQPQNKLLLGFTTGPSGSLKSIATTALQQFKRDRTSKIVLDQILKESEFSKIKEFRGYHNLQFKIDSSLFGDISEDAPDFLRQLSSSQYFSQSSEIALTISDIGESGLPENELVDLVSYLSESDSCRVLTVQGEDSEGKKISMNFASAYQIYRTEIDLRQKLVDEDKAQAILLKALKSFDSSKLQDL
ncbi:MAG: hypothetical protein ACJA2O_004546 [Candidatus Azotimanducaceae bacterium]|jgi:hypothetical protein